MRIAARAAWVRGRGLAYDVTVQCEGRIIAAIQSGQDRSADLTVELLLPGFINAHCHLEYTALAGKLPRGSVPFGGWLDAIIDQKSAMSDETVMAGIRAGEQQLLAGGCTTVFDSTTLRASAAVSSSPLRRFLFHEVLGLSSERAQEQLEGVLPLLNRKEDRVGSGINPHAPYSVGPELREGLKALLKQKPELVCAWHLAETADELKLLDTQTGSIADFLRRRGLPMPYQAGIPVTKEHCASVRALQEDDLLGRCEVAFHLNGGTIEDAAHFRAPRAVVHCPGTHRFFNRPPFPVGEFMKAGCNICLGTDSLASSDTLSMFETLRYAAEDFPYLTGPQLIDMVTRNPARSRVLNNTAPPLGAIEPGYAADFVAIRADINPSTSLRDALLADNSQVKLVIIAGELAYSS